MKAPATMTAGEVNRALDALYRKRSAIGEKLIAAGRGHETAQSLSEKSDPLAKKANAIQNQIDDLVTEIRLRMGPGELLPFAAWAHVRSEENLLIERQSQKYVILAAWPGTSPTPTGMHASTAELAAKKCRTLNNYKTGRVYTWRPT